MRVYNERLILSLMRRRGHLSKIEAARQTGLSVQTASAIMNHLQADGLLKRETPQRGRVGQPTVPFSLDPEGAFSLGLKIGRRSCDLVLIDFVGAWDRATPMVMHCFAGISRSTAGAYVAACALNPERDEMQIAWDIRRASRTAQPNSRIVSIADRLLKRDGRMIHAIEAIGPGELATEGHPFRLDIA